MKKTFQILIFSVSGLIIFTILVLYLKHLGEVKYKNIIAHKKMYCYQTYYKGVVNQALFVRDTSLCDSLKQYYQKLENGITNPSFNFLPHVVPLDTFVYVLEYSRDSSIAKIIFYYKAKRSYFSDGGFVYTHTLHEHRKYNKFSGGDTKVLVVK